MTFSCPHFDMERAYCMKVRSECVPGQPGCVLRANSRFLVPVEQRLRERKAGVADTPGGPALCDPAG